MNSTPTSISSTTQTFAWRVLFGLMGAQVLVYAVIARLSNAFVFGEGFEQRPILLVVALFTACFGLYAVSLFIAVRSYDSRRLVRLVVAGAVVFRGLLLFSQPIQEIDIYRYVWDGAVTSHGANPFRYSPAEVLAEELSQAGESPSGLRRLAHISDESPGLCGALRRIHYPELTTVYPPVSQVVFAVADRLSPSNATLAERVTIMKSTLLIFDLATIGLVWWLLRATGMPAGWLIAYAWCPLVIKEFANSGHLDSIAVCLTTASICCTVRHYVGQSGHSFGWTIVAAIFFGLSVGAKLYAIVLLPLLAQVIARRADLRCGAIFSAAAIIVSAASLAPMFWPFPFDVTPIAQNVQLPNDEGNGIGPTESPSAAAERRSGLTAFLSRWEMNDFLFMLIVENARPAEERPEQPPPWFAVVPNSWRTRMVDAVKVALRIDSDRTAFLLARTVTVALFLGIATVLLGRTRRDDGVTQFLEAAFLTLAWFWLLSPTQNPWYWIWTIPLIPFARNKAWIAVSGLVFIYYLRFWLIYRWFDSNVAGTRYHGRLFFDYVMTWVEFGPWFVWMTWAAILGRRRGSSVAKNVATGV